MFEKVNLSNRLKMNGCYFQKVLLSGRIWIGFCQETGVPFSTWKCTIGENTPFPYKTALSKVMLRQIEWGVQNEPIRKNRVLIINIYAIT